MKVYRIQFEGHYFRANMDGDYYRDLTYGTKYSRDELDGEPEMIGYDWDDVLEQIDDLTPGVTPNLQAEVKRILPEDFTWLGDQAKEQIDIEAFAIGMGLNVAPLESFFQKNYGYIPMIQSATEWLKSIEEAVMEENMYIEDFVEYVGTIFTHKDWIHEKADLEDRGIYWGSQRSPYEWAAIFRNIMPDVQDDIDSFLRLYRLAEVFDTPNKEEGRTNTPAGTIIDILVVGALVVVVFYMSR